MRMELDIYEGIPPCSSLESKKRAYMFLRYDSFFTSLSKSRLSYFFLSHPFRVLTYHSKFCMGSCTSCCLCLRDTQFLPHSCPFLKLPLLDDSFPSFDDCIQRWSWQYHTRSVQCFAAVALTSLQFSPPRLLSEGVANAICPH